jgi:4-deoxy-L-threo-5-hexosulose-uronate ketol-isomerase
VSKTLSTPRAQELATLPNDQVRASFLIDNVAHADKIDFTFTDLDRLAMAVVAPTKSVTLENDRETGAEFFLARRELGALNVSGNAGAVTVDGKRYAVPALGCIYIGMGSKDVRFESADTSKPAKFFLMSCPAHQTYPTTAVSREQCNAIKLGEQKTANSRTIYQYIHPNGIKSCQLVMGFTALNEGSVWNTMPPHTHSRRTEIYFYFDLGQNIVVHLLGKPQETRHVLVGNEQAVLSPSWSIHCGGGTAAYKFIWAMAGENLVFNDMDGVAATELR